MKAELTSIGVTGLKRQRGTVHEEFLRELQGDRWRKIIKEMADQDPIVGAILYVVEMLMRQVEWRVQAASEDKADVEAAEFVEQCLHDMSAGWQDTVSEILTMLPYGWAWMEEVYKVRRGPEQEDGRFHSQYNDGRVGWRKWGIRAQDTLLEWAFDDEGGIQAMVQQDPNTFATYRIPIEKSLLFRTAIRKGNPEGKSILRNSYRPWYFKKHIENIEGIGVERDLAGLPVAYVPPEIMADTASAEQKAIYDALKNIVVNIRRDEMEGIVFPLIYDDNGHKMYDLALLSSGGQRQFDTDKIIQRYSRQIAMSVLADFVLVGHEAVGSFAMVDSKTNLFILSLKAYLHSIAGVVNTHAIPRLFKLNGWKLAALPKLAPGDIEKVDLTVLADYISKLAGSGFPLFPNAELEQMLLEKADLPVPQDLAHAG